MARRRDPRASPDGLVDERPGVVGTAVAQRVGHGLQARRLLVVARRAPVPEARYSAHGFEVSVLGPLGLTVCRIGERVSSRGELEQAGTGPVPPACWGDGWSRAPGSRSPHGDAGW